MKNQPQPEVESFLPLTPALFHVLLALADSDKHGYAILKDVALRTNDEVHLSTGTLYGIIKRLLNEGLIEQKRKPSAAVHEDARRIYYHLTPLGRQVAAAEADRHQKLVELARIKKILGRPRTA